MLNVAVSRAVKSLVVVISNNDENAKTNYGDLAKYIEYNNFQIVDSKVFSVFDMLYKGYYEQRRQYLKKHKRVSEYDSENLMYSVIVKILNTPEFSKVDCVVHSSLATLVKDYSVLTEPEIRYASNPLTHIDFLLFNKMDKSPVLTIEVDGVKYYNPMMIYPAIHYTMGGLWVDYELSTNIPGLFAIGECNFSDHGANRLGASALMQGLADGYFVLPYTIQNYLADQAIWPHIPTDRPEFDEAEKGVQAEIDRLMGIHGKRSVDSIHKELGHIMWEHVGMGRTKEGLEEGIKLIQKIRKEFNTNLFIPGSKEGLNVELDKAIHLRDFILMGELIAHDALSREESCGGHFREEHQTPEGEAQRDDENFFYVGCWEYQNNDETAPELIKEPLEYEAIKVQTRNYKN